MFFSKQYDLTEYIQQIQEDNWKPFFQEFAEKLAPMAGAPGSLLSLANEMKSNGIPVLNLSDYESGGIVTQLKELDPISLMACVTHANFSDEQKIASCTYLKNRLSISAEVPIGFRGLAPSDGKGLFLPYATDRKEDDVFALGDIFKEAVENSFVGEENLERIRQVKEVGVRITVALSWIKPDVYAPFDYVFRTFCKIGTSAFTPLNVHNMRRTIEKARKKIGDDLPAAYLLTRSKYTDSLAKQAGEVQGQ